MMRHAFLLIVITAAMVMGVNSAIAKEEILLFHSHIVVNPDSSLTVTETITVRAEGKNIKRGIYRDFPTNKASIWYNHRNGFEVLSVQRDGRDEPYHFEQQQDHLRVYFGKEDVMLKSGVYKYTLQYKTTRQIRYFEEHDELYWNVNGTQWMFPIQKIQAIVKLPNSATPSGPLEAYTGSAGMKGKDYICKAVSANGPASYFVTTRGFRAYENMTIVVPFAKGVVYEPTSGEKFAILLGDNKMLVAMTVGMLILLGYYLIAWHKVGRDPKSEIIIPRFEAPKDISPAGAGFLHKMSFDSKCVIAAIVSMAVKGYLKITEADHGYTLEKVKPDNPLEALCHEEKDALGELFSGKDRTLEMKQENHTNLRNTRTAVKTSLKKHYMTPFFLNNTQWFVVGLVLTGLIMTGSTILSGRVEVIFLCVFVSVWTAAVTALLKQVINRWKRVSSQKGLIRAGGAAGAIFITLFTIPFLAGEILLIGLLAIAATIWMVLIAIAIGLINLKFWFWLKQPTVTGQKLMDEIEGFKMYLATVEGAVPGQPGPAKTLELFEEYLPYAIALGVEKQWAGQFDHLFNMDMQRSGTHMAWYAGTGLAAGSASAFASSFSSGFSGAMSSASSSGSGGGGSSGGGGGGGGGGGW
ncbi:MAG: DUF2207 domain-containing protein [bacterium]|nr:DUF2207 domain-containing protein [bacterium]